LAHSVARQDRRADPLHILEALPSAIGLAGCQDMAIFIRMVQSLRTAELISRQSFLDGKYSPNESIGAGGRREARSSLPTRRVMLRKTQPPGDLVICVPNVGQLTLVAVFSTRFSS
jgi:hypothetical protein